MPQTSVENEPAQAYEGKVQYGPQYPTTMVTRLASGLIYFGKGVTFPLADVEVGNQTCHLPATIPNVTGAFGGVAIADPSLEQIVGAGGVPEPFGAYPDEEAVSVMRKGAIWVVVDTAITALGVSVYLQYQNAGGSPPVDSLGSFDSVSTGDNQVLPNENVVWKGAATIGSVNFGLLELNLP